MSLLNHFVHDGLSRQHRRKVKLLALLSFIGVLLMLAYAFFWLMRGNYILGLTNLVSAIILTSNLYFVKRNTMKQWNLQLGILIFSILVVMLYLFTTVEQNTYLWYFSYPGIAAFLLGSKQGRKAIILMSLPILFSMIFGSSLSFIADYQFAFEVRFFITYSLVGYLSLLFESISERDIRDIKLLNESLEAKVSERTNELAHKNELLAEKIDESRAASEAISQALKEKEILLKEVYHRTKNNMNVIISLLDLQQRNMDKKSINDVFHVLSNRIRSMSLIHEKLYQSDNVTTIDLSEYITNLTHELRSAITAEKDEIQLIYEAEHLQIGLNQAIPLGLVINEIMSNSFKHAKVEGQVLTLTVKLDCDPEDRVHLQISDNGPGLPEDYHERTKSSLGTHLIHILIRDQLNGEVKFKSKHGTQCHIEFPLQKV